MLELTPRDFVMTRGEAAALLELAGAELTAADVDALVRRTEGWPAGLYLAAVSLRDQPDTAAAIARFGGDDRVVSDYVADSLLSELTAEEVTFLQRTSVLDRLSGAAVRCRAGGVGLGREAAGPRAGQRPGRPSGPHRRVVPLPRALWPRCCRAQLRRREPELEPELHPAREPLACPTRRRRTPRIRHAAAAETFGSRAICCGTNASGTSLRATTRPSAAGSVTSADEQVAGYAPLALVAANAHLAEGDRDHAEHWTAAAARALDGIAGRRRPPAIEAGVAAMRARRSPATACSACATMPHGRTRWMRTPAHGRSMDRLLEGTACHLLGERERAIRAAGGGITAWRGRRAERQRAVPLASCAAGARRRRLGPGHRARGTRARSQIERFRLAAYPTMSLVLAVAAADPGPARARPGGHGGRAPTRRGLLDAMDDFAPWYVAEVRIVPRARGAAPQSTWSGARALVEGPRWP
jgi:LuxR family maltose regulon positive regulatory protein